MHQGQENGMVSSGIQSESQELCPSALFFSRLYFGHGGFGYNGLAVLVFVGAMASKTPFCHWP